MKKVSGSTLSELIVVASTRSEEEVRALILSMTAPAVTAEPEKLSQDDFRKEYIRTGKRLQIAKQAKDGHWYIPKAKRPEAYEDMRSRGLDW